MNTGAIIFIELSIGSYRKERYTYKPKHEFY